MPLNVYERQKSKVVSKRKMRWSVEHDYNDEDVENFDITRAEKAAKDLGYEDFIKGINKYLK